LDALYEQTNQVRATKKIVFNLSSIQEAAPIRKYKQTENMSSNIQGETIPMACSSFSSNILNKQLLEDVNSNYLLSNLDLLGKQFSDVRKNDLYPQIAEPNQLKRIFMKKFLKRKKSYQERKVNQGIEAKRSQVRIVFWKVKEHQSS
jgi:hypothetical protein